MLYFGLALAGFVLARAIFGPVVSFVDEMPGANGRNNLFSVRVKRGPYQAAVFAQELWESPRALLRAIPGYRRGAQIFSHEVEAQAAGLAYGEDVTAYRHAEARRMRGYPELAGMTTEEIEGLMWRQADKALAWVIRNRNAILAARDR